MTTATGATLRRIQLGNALSAFGSGFTVPYLFIYVADVRGLGATTAGAVLAAFAAAALLVLPLVGRLLDRRGPVPVALAGTLAAAVGALGFGMTASAAAVLTAAAVLGAGVAVLQPALATMIVWCSSPANRSRAFATQFFLINLGMGVGGLLGGLIVDEHAAASFTLLFSVQAVMFLVLGGVLLTVRLPRSPALDEAVPTAADGAGTGWRVLLADRAMVVLGVLGFVLFFSCYGQFESGLAAYGVEVTGISTSTLGLALFANTAVIMLAQFVVLRMVHGRRRSRVVALVGVVWAVAWVAAGASGLVPQAPALATALFISTYALFGLGEAMLSPTVAPLVADLAPRHMVGQYNSAFALVKQLGVAVGPAVGGLLAAQGAFVGYIVLLVLCSLGIAVLALLLGRRLTPVQDNPALRPSQVVLASGRRDPGTDGAGQPVTAAA
ncbi:MULTISPECIES: MFS transporter [unclassified Streptomyces]|uniref:MFS transporter n=1 Tax=unclassified Streptomyces TaxID=2593676 RepID=UPI0022B750E5|nr:MULTISPECIES: MFS transporter [unclassified Streptomyces]MCZ7417500.1 MFS transporter [Streptomyces sp. WMMC897]MCZ7432671.1 MFS transporter [Streptomyces sp. WMMC1477]